MATDQEHFAVLVRASLDDHRTVETFDTGLNARLAVAEEEYQAIEDTTKWIEKKISKVEEAQVLLNDSLPGTAERLTALEQRVAAREDLLAADLIVWRNSSYYNPSVETRMREATLVVTDADLCIETTLAHLQEAEAIAHSYELQKTDVERILSIIHGDYLKPRNGLTRPISDLASQEDYAHTTAYVFRVNPEVVKKIMDHAARHSTIPKSAQATSLADFLDD